jgi:lysophospholipase L1-like esterase
VRICAACFGEFSDAIHRAAAARGVPVAGYYAAFSGPNGDQPLPSDWTRDELHPSQAGAEALAAVMADLGYEPVAPTGH